MNDGVLHFCHTGKPPTKSDYSDLLNSTFCPQIVYASFGLSSFLTRDTLDAE